MKQLCNWLLWQVSTD